MKKLQPGIRKILETVAEGLPPMLETVPEFKVRVSGATLIENKITKIKDGTEVDPKKYYVSTSTEQKVDHYKVLRKIVKAAKSEDEAILTVKKYQTQVMNKFKEGQSNVETNTEERTNI